MVVDFIIVNKQGLVVKFKDDEKNACFHTFIQNNNDAINDDIGVHGLYVFQEIESPTRDEHAIQNVKIHDMLYGKVLSGAFECDQECKGYVLLKYTNASTDKFGNQEINYLNLLEKIMIHGNVRDDRTGTGTISCFGEQVRFDISENVPLLTTKNVPWRLVIEELLWFMRGDTDSGILEARNVNIWKGNTSREFLDGRGLTDLPEGDIGCGYGFQWRHFGGDYVNCKTDYGTGVGFDQLAYVIEQLKTDPTSRRIMMTAWNPKDMHRMALPPCHNQVQFYVTQNKDDGTQHLSCHMYQRSVDTFLGFPWNILSYTVMTYILAAMCNMKPKELVISTGDTHIYKDHIAQVQEQLHKRKPLPWPKLVVSEGVRNKKIEELTISDFKVYGYFSHPTIKAKMSV